MVCSGAVRSGVRTEHAHALEPEVLGHGERIGADLVHRQVGAPVRDAVRRHRQRDETDLRERRGERRRAIVTTTIVRDARERTLSVLSSLAYGLKMSGVPGPPWNAMTGTPSFAPYSWNDTRLQRRQERER